MKVFLDCCALMDFFQGRENGEHVETILAIAQEGHLSCYTSSVVVCTLAYLFEKYKVASKKEIPNIIKSLTDIVTVLPVTSDDISSAIVRSTGDFEDAVECACAERFCDCIVTDNTKDFAAICSIGIFSPKDFDISEYML